MPGRGRRRSAALVGVAALLVVAVALTVVVTWRDTASDSVALRVTATPASVPAAVRPQVAPYLGLTAPNVRSLNAGIDAGLTHVTASFVIGAGCRAVWDDGVRVSSDAAKAAVITRAQDRGVQVAISFGGASGTDLARSCRYPRRLRRAYESVIRTFHPARIDLDVEGAALDPVAQRASIARRFAAVRALRRMHPSLVVSATLPVGLEGLEPDGVSFLRVARRTGTRIDVVNVMTMDYGQRVRNMGVAAVRSTRHTVRQVRAIWPAYPYARIGITPMIGRNDTAGEVVLRLAQARYVARFARSRGVGLLAFWSLNRDRRCSGAPSGPRTAAPASGSARSGSPAPSSARADPHRRLAR